MSPRRRGRGRGNSGVTRGPVAAADAAAAPSASASAADVSPLAQDAGAAVDRSTPAVSTTSEMLRTGSGFSPTGGPGSGPGRSGNVSRGVHSRRPPRANTTSNIAPRPIAASPVAPSDVSPSSVAPSDVATTPQQDAGVPDQALGQRLSSCTLAQMRRFIKSRPYVPVHELRRRFLIDGLEDEVSPVATGQRTLYVGLPPREAQFLGDLVRSGEVGCEMLLDPTSPGVVGVYPMRPVARQ